ncbi:MAG: hypothetical protein AB7T10_02640 [bacterium]
MTALKTILISLLLFSQVLIFSENLFFDYDSLFAQGYVKTCKDTMSCEMTFFKLRVYSDSLHFSITANDSIYSQIEQLKDKKDLLYTVKLFIEEIETDTSKKANKNFITVKYEFFEDTLFYKPKQTIPSSYHFYREKLLRIAYFTNLAIYKETEKTLK